MTEKHLNLMEYFKDVDKRDTYFILKAYWAETLYVDWRSKAHTTVLVSYHEATDF